MATGRPVRPRAPGGYLSSTRASSGRDDVLRPSRDTRRCRSAPARARPQTVTSTQSSGRRTRSHRPRTRHRHAGITEALQVLQDRLLSGLEPVQLGRHDVPISCRYLLLILPGLVRPSPSPDCLRSCTSGPRPSGRPGRGFRGKSGQGAEHRYRGEKVVGVFSASSVIYVVYGVPGLFAYLPLAVTTTAG